jgi:diaminohydroxyphosphoribosylaminopyrimidine deaminase/5-amino-6-(5-phosphoribosylamino)uracil reductase
LRIIVDSHLRTPLESKVVSEAYVPGGTLIACLDSVDESVRDRFIAKGVKIELFPISVDKRIDLRMLAGVLGSKYSVQSLVVEGGAGIIAGVLAAGLVDRYIATIAPKLIGGSQAPGPIGGQGLAQRMADAYAVRDWIIRRSGPDILIDGTMDSRMV